MSLTTWLAGRLHIGDGPCLTSQDAKLWAQPTDLRGLGELTALWLEGRIDSQPGYYGPVDEDIAPGLTATLVALNRAGFLTNNSQGGHNDAYTQEAWVVGFANADTFCWLRDALSGSRFQMRSREPARYRWDWRRSDPLVLNLTEQNIADLYEGVSRAALDALHRAVQVTIYDLESGPNDLWPILRAAAIAQGMAA